MREGWARQEWYAELHQEVKAADDLARHRAASKKRREGSVRCALLSARRYAWLCCAFMTRAPTWLPPYVLRHAVAGAAEQGAAHPSCRLWRRGLGKGQQAFRALALAATRPGETIGSVWVEPDGW